MGYSCTSCTIPSPKFLFVTSVRCNAPTAWRCDEVLLYITQDAVTENIDHQHSTAKRSTVQYCAVQCSAVQCRLECPPRCWRGCGHRERSQDEIHNVSITHAGLAIAMSAQVNVSLSWLAHATTAPAVTNSLTVPVKCQRMTFDSPAHASAPDWCSMYVNTLN